MRALIDTNVLLDFLLGREPHYSNADQIIKLCAEQKVQGFMAALKNSAFPDLKDCLQSDNSEVPAVLPEDFLKVVQV